MIGEKGNSPESIVREIKRQTRRKFMAEEKIRIVLEGLRGEAGITDLCRKEGIHPTMYYKWSKGFLEAGKRQLNGDTIREIRVVASVLESEIGKMKPGQEVDLRFNAYPGKTFKGRVLAVSPVVNPEEKTCAVHIAVSNPEEELKPGMHAEVEIAADVYPDRLLVPQEAVLVRGGRKLVFVIENGLAKWKYVTTGLENERYVEILSGVGEGEMIIVEGHLTLAHDARVKVVE